MGLSKEGHVIFSNEVGSCWEAGAEDEGKIDEKRVVSLGIDVINENNYESKCDSVHNTRRLEV